MGGNVKIHGANGVGSNTAVTEAVVDDQGFLGVTQRNSRFTSFEELITGIRRSKFNFKPTWGISTLRDTVTETGTGAAVIETNGEFKLSTGTTTGNVVSVRTKERGQYQAGAEGEAGMGVRIPVSPTGTEYFQWGYFDDNNGFGYGVDSTGVYVFRRDGGVDDKTYQSNWNRDKLDGNGRSEQVLDLSDGNIFQINFVWYGYGAINFFLNIKNTQEDAENRVLVHSITVAEQASIVDPNQPITIQGFNGASNTTSRDIYVGGRQFSIVNGDSEPNTRNTSIELGPFSVTTTSFTPVASIRKKANFNGRENSVNCFVNDLQALTDNPVIVMIKYGATSSGGTYQTPSDTLASETAMEVKPTLTGASGGTSVDKFFASGTQASSQAIARQERISFGQADELVIYVKKTGTNASTRLIIDVDEEW